MSSEALSVPAGVYEVQLFYSTDTNMKNYCSISDASAAHGEFLGNGEHLYAGLHSTRFDVWIMDGNGSMKLEVSYGVEGSVLVQGARISDTGAMQRIMLTVVAALFLLMDAAWFYYEKKKEQGILVEKKLAVLALAGIAFYASLPLFTDYLLSGGDLGFHLLRIEGIKDGLLSGQFTVKIAPEWQQ